ncbi:MAG: hypothetical protein L0H37_06950, partial [Nitrosospira sp.]|nr:hypothetical protein [Nitrosospira sp.]
MNNATKRHAWNASLSANLIPAINIKPVARAVGLSLFATPMVWAANTGLDSIGVNGGATTTCAGSSSSAVGNYNVCLGDHAGESLSGDDNIVSGRQAGQSLTGNNNIVSGFRAGQHLSGNDNIASGRQAGQSLTGNNNIVSG